MKTKKFTYCAIFSMIFLSSSILAHTINGRGVLNTPKFIINNQTNYPADIALDTNNNLSSVTMYKSNSPPTPPAQCNNGDAIIGFSFKNSNFTNGIINLYENKVTYSSSSSLMSMFSPQTISNPPAITQCNPAGTWDRYCSTCTFNLP